MSTRPTALRATVLVAVGSVSWLVLLGLSLAGRGQSLPWALALGVVGVAWFGCRARIRDIAERRERELDEYELLQRHRARNVGYGAALVAALVVYVFFSIAVQLAERGQDHLLLQAHHVVLAIFLPAAAGPSFLLAWDLRGQEDMPD